MTPGRYEKQRREDHDWLAKGAAFIEHYRVIAWPLLAILAGVGFRIVTPKQTAAELGDKITAVETRLATKIDATNSQVVALEVSRDSLVHAHANMERYLLLIVRKMCLDLSNRDRKLVGLTLSDCNE